MSLEGVLLATQRVRVYVEAEVPTRLGVVPRDAQRVATRATRLVASTGTRRVRYEGYAGASITMLSDIETEEESRVWTTALDLDLMDGAELVHPFTTTLAEVTIDPRPAVVEVLPFVGATRA